MKNKLDHSREFDVWIWSNKPEVVKSANFLFSKIKKIKPKNLTDKNLKKHLKMIITDLYVARKSDSKLYISVSLNNNEYRMPKKYKKLFINMDYFRYVINYLKDNKYIEYHKGIHFSYFKRNSRIRASESLVRLFRKYKSTEGLVIRRTPPVYLRDSNKNYIDFDIDNVEVKTIIHNVNKINKFLTKNHSVTFGESLDFSVDYRQVSKLMNTKTKYYRTFNNSSFEQGGRFYGHWSQMIDSDWRRYILIDGHETVELDYSCLHLSMLYAKENLIPPNRDLYELDGVDTVFRKLIKKTINIVINAETEKSAIRAILHENKDIVTKFKLKYNFIKELLDKIKNAHNKIRKYFCSGYGIKLQFIDSMLAEEIMLKLYSQNICCLCIHDSFIVANHHKDILYNTMRDVFYDKFNFYPIIKSK